MNSRRKKIPVKNAKKILQQAFEWCVERFGSPLKNGDIPNFIISYERNSDCFGYYCSLEKEIVIFPFEIQSKSMLIRSVIHEYTHFLQMPKTKEYPKYLKMEKKYGYENNPFEIGAYEAELKYYRTCYSYLKRNGVV